MSYFNNTTEELISSEQLQVFNVIEIFCEICGDLTPHHIDGSKIHNEEDEISPDAICRAPISLQECVVCRENEESQIQGMS
jgi:hypothetical protein